MTLSVSLIPQKQPDEAAAGIVDLQIHTPGLSPEEIAAVTAVMSAAVEASLSEAGSAVAPSQSEWMATRRPLRGTVQPGPNHWGRKQ